MIHFEHLFMVLSGSHGPFICQAHVTCLFKITSNHKVLMFHRLFVPPLGIGLVHSFTFSEDLSVNHVNPSFNLLKLIDFQEHYCVAYGINDAMVRLSTYNQ